MRSTQFLVLPTAAAALLFACGSDSEPTGYGVNRGNLARPNQAATASVRVDPGPVSVVQKTPAQPTNQSVDSPGALVPNDAIAYIEIASADELGRMMGTIGDAIDPSMSAMFGVEQMLSGMLMRGGEVSEVRRDAPIGIALTLSSETGEPEPTFILPVTDGRTFANSLMSMPGMARPVNGGQWVGIPMGAQYSVSEGVSPLAESMPSSCVSARVDAQRLIAQYRPMIGMALAGMQQNMSDHAGGMSPAEAQISEMTIEWVNDFIDSAGHVELSLDLDADEMDFAYSLSMRDGSPLSKFGSDSTNALQELAGYIQTQDTFSIMAGWDDAFYQEHVRPMVELFADLSEENAAFLSDVLEHVDEYCELMGSSVVATGDWSAGQMQVASYFKPADPAKAATRFQEIVGSIPAPPYGSIEGPTETEKDGTKIISFAVVFDPERADPRMEEIFGSTTLTIQLASRGEHMVACLGGDESFAEQRIAALGQPARSIPTDLAQTFERISKSNPSFVYRLDMLGVMRSVPQMFASDMGAGAPEMDLSALDAMGDEPLVMTLYGAIDGPVWHGGMVTDFTRLGEFIQAQDR
ncbi:MAG: hypothetical protein GY711_08545 [bacterium]|nr:hypothetical protein [bacterium]